MKKKFTYQSTKKLLLAMFIVGILLLLAAERFFRPGETVRTVLIAAGVVLYVAAFAVIYLTFRCPVCGTHFIRNAFTLHSCPACGFRFDDFELGKKTSLSGARESSVTDTGGVQDKHRN